MKAMEELYRHALDLYEARFGSDTDHPGALTAPPEGGLGGSAVVRAVHAGGAVEEVGLRRSVRTRSRIR